MLRRLAGTEHRVLSGVALLGPGHCERTAVSESRVRMRPVTEAEIAAYWATGEPVDKAGGYAIQGRAAVFIEALAGSYSGRHGAAAVRDRYRCSQRPGSPPLRTIQNEGSH